jgi:hypothetical protein
LDQACGPGAIIEALHNEFASPATQPGMLPNWHLQCTDISPPMLDAIRESAEQNNWKDLEITQSNILDNGLLANTFDYVFASFGKRHIYYNICLCEEEYQLKLYHYELVFMALSDSAAGLDGKKFYQVHRQVDSPG